MGEEAVGPSRSIFRNFGDMSSATVVFVLERAMSSGEFRWGDFALMAAMGAGFSAEGALRCSTI